MRLTTAAQAAVPNAPIVSVAAAKNAAKNKRQFAAPLDRFFMGRLGPVSVHTYARRRPESDRSKLSQPLPALSIEWHFSKAPFTPTVAFAQRPEIARFGRIRTG